MNIKKVYKEKSKPGGKIILQSNTENYGWIVKKELFPIFPNSEEEVGNYAKFTINGKIKYQVETGFKSLFFDTKEQIKEYFKRRFL